MPAAPKFGLLAVAVAASLLLVELALRWHHESGREAIADRAGLPRLCARPDPDLVYTYVPNECGHNAEGYRDVQHRAKKPPGVRRIVVIGDSVAEGGGVHVFQGFGSLLGKQLSEKGTPWEAVILARSGYGTAQQITLLDREAYHYEPDLILWSYVLNDPAHPVHHNPSGERGKYYYRPTSYLLHTIDAAWFGLRERWRNADCPNEYHARLHCMYWPEIQASFTHLAQIARDRGVPLVVVLHPVFEKNRAFDAYSLRELHHDLTGLAKRHGLPVIDLLAAYQEHPADDLRQRKRTDWFDPWHPSARGHQVAADAIEAGLTRSGLLKPPDASSRPDGNAIEVIHATPP